MDLDKICLSCIVGEIDGNGFCSSCGRPQLLRQSTACALPLQTILHGRYLIGAVLGQGGFGITYVAYDLIENRRVVIKELYPTFLVRRTPGETRIAAIKNMELFVKYRDRFVEEARLIYTFRDTPEIVDVYHIFIENNTGYYSMEYLDGQTLHRFRNEQGKRLTWEQLKPIVKDIINALRVVHRSGSIHRDISPDNIFLSRDGVAKLIDFGSARYFTNAQKMTQILKKGFAPWEQYQSDGTFGPWTDIYALAATIYVCLTGRMLPEATARVLNDTVQRPSLCGAVVPDYVDYAVMQALSIYPKQRFQSVESFANALRLFDEAQVIHSSTGEQWQVRCICGYYVGMSFPLTSNIIVGRDPDRCTLIFPSDSIGISGVHFSLLNGSGPSFPGIRCESASQIIYINGAVFNGRGHIKKLQNGDRISFGDNQIFVVERLK